MTVSRRSAVEPFHAMDVLAEANRLAALGKPVISMAVGQPSDPAPRPVLEAARKALEQGRLGYTNALGIDALRNRIERCFNKLKNARSLASRYDKTAASYLGFIHIVSIRLWMRQFVNAS